jgi:hypothetical protein
MSNDDGRLIYLYTSNIRARYVADAVAATAQPTGTRLRFRYDRRHVSDALAGAWAGIEGREALIVFSIQHTSRFHASAYVPLRRATVIATSRQGEILVVDLELGSYLSLAPSSPTARRSLLGFRVRAFSDALRGSDVHADNPDSDKSAGLGASVAQLSEHLRAQGITLVDRDDEAFRAIVEYFSATLTDPEWFYYRVAALSELGNRAREVKPKKGAFRLRTGKRYQVTVVQYQTSLAMLPANVLVTAGSGIEVHGLGRLELRSTYDVYSIPIDIDESPSIRRTHLELAPEGPTRGPTVRLDLALRPSVAQTWALPAAGAAGAVAVTVAASDVLNDGWQLAVGTVATLALFVAGVWQTKRGLSLF